MSDPTAHGPLFAEKNDDPTWRIHNDFETIARVGTGLGMAPSTVAAYANLFAAAPNILAALIEAEALIAKNTYPCPDKPHSAWGILCRVREAIAKAKP